jgi:hypothetical protein
MGWYLVHDPCDPTAGDLRSASEASLGLVRNLCLQQQVPFLAVRFRLQAALAAAIYILQGRFHQPQVFLDLPISGTASLPKDSVRDRLRLTL